jgi:hypothetical protein
MNVVPEARVCLRVRLQKDNASAAVSRSVSRPCSGNALARGMRPCSLFPPFLLSRPRETLLLPLTRRHIWRRSQAQASLLLSSSSSSASSSFLHLDPSRRAWGARGTSILPLPAADAPSVERWDKGLARARETPPEEQAASSGPSLPPGPPTPLPRWLR